MKLMTAELAKHGSNRSLEIQIGNMAFNRTPIGWNRYQDMDDFLFCNPDAEIKFIFQEQINVAGYSSPQYKYIVHYTIPAEKMDMPSKIEKQLNTQR